MSPIKKMSGKKRALESLISIAGIISAILTAAYSAHVSQYINICEYKLTAGKDLINQVSDYKTVVKYEIGIPETCYIQDGTANVTIQGVYNPDYESVYKKWRRLSIWLFSGA